MAQLRSALLHRFGGDFQYLAAGKPLFKRLVDGSDVLPLLRRETIAALAIASANAPDLMWRTACEGTPGSPVIFPQWAFAALQNLPEGKGGGVLIKKYPERLRTVNVRDMYELKDVDSPEDLQALLER